MALSPGTRTTFLIVIRPSKISGTSFSNNLSRNTGEEEEEFISIKDEVRFENKIKIVDHIDLNPEKKTQPEPVEAKVEQPKRETQEEITEKVEEPKVTRVEVEETQEEERKVTPEVEPEISVQMEESSGSR